MIVIPRECYIELCCSNDDMRWALLHPWFENGSLIATDGKRLAMIEVEWDKDDLTGYVPKELIKAARLATKKDGFIMIDLSDTKVAKAQTKTGMITMDRLQDCQFPNYAAVIPKERVYDAKVVLDVFMMHELGKALGAKADDPSVEFIIDWRNFEPGPVLTPTMIVGKHGFGMQMPVRVNEDRKKRHKITLPITKPCRKEKKVKA